MVEDVKKEISELLFRFSQIKKKGIEYEEEKERNRELTEIEQILYNRNKKNKDIAMHALEEFNNFSGNNSELYEYLNNLQNTDWAKILLDIFKKVGITATDEVVNEKIMDYIDKQDKILEEVLEEKRVKEFIKNESKTEIDSDSCDNFMQRQNLLCQIRELISKLNILSINRMNEYEGYTIFTTEFLSKWIPVLLNYKRSDSDKLDYEIVTEYDSDIKLNRNYLLYHIDRNSSKKKKIGKKEIKDFAYYSSSKNESFYILNLGSTSDYLKSFKHINLDSNEEFVKRIANEYYRFRFDESHLKIFYMKYPIFKSFLVNLFVTRVINQRDELTEEEIIECIEKSYNDTKKDIKVLTAGEDALLRLIRLEKVSNEDSGYFLDYLLKLLRFEVPEVEISYSQVYYVFERLVPSIMEHNSLIKNVTTDTDNRTIKLKADFEECEIGFADNNVILFNTARSKECLSEKITLNDNGEVVSESLIRRIGENTVFEEHYEHQSDKECSRRKLTAD